MVLIIPTIPIHQRMVSHAEGLRDLVCACQISLRACGTLAAKPNAAIYSESPLDRARLLRKENAKTIHLEFWDNDPWSTEAVEIVRKMRSVVDIPFELSLAELPPSMDALDPLFDAGVYRVFLPLNTSERMVFEYIDRFTSRKIVPTVDLQFDFAVKLAEFKARKIDRLSIEISPADELEDATINWTRLREIVEMAKNATVRLTAQHGVRGYPDLRELQDMGPALDSLVLNRALNENRFPCQLIWREIEAEYATEVDPTSNLWTNPLEGKPHL